MRKQILNDEECETMADICGNAYFIAEDVRNIYEKARSKDEALLRRALLVIKMGHSYGMGYKVHELISEIEKQLE